MELPFGLSAVQIVTLMGIAAMGGFMRGFAGFGATLVMVPLFSLHLAPAEAVLIAIAVDVVAVAPLFPNAARTAKWRPIIPLMIASLLVTPLGVYLLLVAPANALRIAIAVMVIASALIMLSGWTYKGEKTIPLSLGVGALSGTLGTAVGIGGPPVAVYFLASGDSTLQTRAALNAMSFIKMGISAIGIAIGGSFGSGTYVTVVILVPVMAMFTWVGARVFRASTDAGSRRALLIILFAIGVLLLARSIVGGA